MGGAGGGVPCSLPASPCADDANPCTVEACTNGFCTVALLDMVMGPGSSECITIDCAKGAPTKTIHDGKACGGGGTLQCVGEVCTGCNGDTACGTTDDCQTATCLPDMTCNYGYKPIGTACAGGTTFCDASQKCVECAIDANCAPGKTCYQQSGCVSCSDKFKNGDETDVDCGGSCSPCADKLACILPKDCKSTMCENGTCISCTDGVKNGGEAGIDCGGVSTCLACPGTACSVATECALGFCYDTVCCDKACTDPCKSCNLAGKAGVCSDVPLGYADPACSAATPVCKTGVCVDNQGKSPLGDACVVNSDCFSNNCQGNPKTCK
jgi:hypothetical protein